MARKNTGVLNDLMVISAKLPWQVGVLLAVISYVVLHHFADRPPLTTSPDELKAMGKTIGDSAAQAIWTGIARVLQYVVPLALLVGAGGSAIRRRAHGMGGDAGAVPVDAPSCPKCGSSMVRRVAKQGSNAGNAFWGCSQYPSCRGIRNA